MFFRATILIALPFAAAICAADFEVASVKRDTSPGIGIHLIDPVSGRVELRKHALRDYIRFAWNTREDQVTGGPAWLDSDVYEVVAKATPGTPEPELRTMLQNLLIERFALQLRLEQRPVAGFALTATKKGPKLVPAATGDAPKLYGKPSLRPGDFRGTRSDMAQLSDALTHVLGQPVIDRTGIQGSYSITLTWAPDIEPGRPKDSGGALPDDTTAPSLFTAIQEQLGLKLDAIRTPAEFLIIERASRPSSN